ncbi:hypothetical protein F5887DRAFT_347065 [Amanita rubescens]|nr:hypothetical protein F5887DRAFT_347065 [Amanita rubescens]
MLFLLFFFLGTSFVIADPPGGSRGNDRVQGASRVQKPRQKPRVVPPLRTQFQQVPSTSLAHQKLVFPEIKNLGRSFSGTYYRKPTKHVKKYYANDVIDILLDGTIIPYSLPDQFGGPLVQNGFVPGEERERLVGDWSLMPSALNEIGRRYDHLVFITSNDGKLHVNPLRREVTMLSSPKETSRSIEQAPPPNCNCKGLWYRLPTKDAYKGYAKDVAEIFPESGVVDIYELTDKPGMFKAGYGRLKRYERSRLVGIWLRMQSAKLKINHRRDQLTVDYDKNGKLRYQVFRQAVEMLGDISPKPFPWTGDVQVPEPQDVTRLPQAVMPVP